MGSVKIGLGHMFALTLLFEIGTAQVVNLGIESGRDAWISILIGCACGIAVFGGYLYLYRVFPDKPLSGYVRILFGKYAGWLVGLLYMVLFVNLAARDLRDGGTLLVMASLQRTPLFVVSALMILSCAYVAHKGLEVLARTALVFSFFVVLIGMLCTLLLLLSGAVHWERLLPVTGNGWMPVARSVLKQNYMFPFGEMICFTMLMPYLTDARKGAWTILLAMGAAGMVLSFTMAINISVLGVDIVARAPLPLMPSISKISISDFIQRVDVLVVMVLVIGVFFKVSVFFTAALIGLSDLFALPYRTLVYPVALITLFVSMLDARGLTEHLDEGGRLLYTVYPWFMLVLPAIMIAVAAVRSYSSSNRSG